MKLFSKRNGIVKTEDILQKDSMNEDLQIGIWNVLSTLLWDQVSEYSLDNDWEFFTFFKKLWANFLKYPIDTLSSYWQTTYKKTREIFFNFKWFEVYDFLEFTVQNYPKHNREEFIKKCNMIFEEESSAYRFIGETISEITSKEEIDEIQNTLDNSPITVKQHINSALKLLGDKKKSPQANLCLKHFSIIS